MTDLGWVSMRFVSTKDPSLHASAHANFMRARSAWAADKAAVVAGGEMLALFKSSAFGKESLPGRFRRLTSAPDLGTEFIAQDPTPTRMQTRTPWCLRPLENRCLLTLATTLGECTVSCFFTRN